MNSALDMTVEGTRPIPFSLTSGETREETANRRADDGRRAANLRKHDLSDRPLSEQTTMDRIAAADKPVRCFKDRTAEPKQSRASSEHPQLERAIPLSRPNDAPSDSLDRAPIGDTQVLRTGQGKLDEGITKHDALFGLHRTITLLTLPRLPAIHIQNGNHYRSYRHAASEKLDEVTAVRGIF
jgi:hypothetical protein